MNAQGKRGKGGEGVGNLEDRVAALEAALAQEVADRITADSAEATAREAADQTLLALAMSLCEEIGNSLGASLPSANAIALCGPFEKLVFVTSTTYAGDLKSAGEGATGFEGADKLCNLRAQNAGLPGMYKAWLSGDFFDAKDRVTNTQIPYVLTTGVTVANDFGDLLNCNNPNYLIHN